MTTDRPIVFPDFYVEAAQMDPDTRNQWESTRFGQERLPVVVTPEGFAFDPAWAPFGVLHLPTSAMAYTLLADALHEGKVPWDIRCPAMADHESLIAHLIVLYGRSAVQGLHRPADSPEEWMKRRPLPKLLSQVSSADLVRFVDRDDTLLDLAFAHQQWQLAELLWDKGVRWSNRALATGQPLEALILTSKNLQKNLIFAANDALPAESTSEARLVWLKRWQERYVQAGGAVTPAPGLHARAQMARENNFSAAQDIVDTPAGFWIARFTDGTRGLLPVRKNSEQANAVIGTWVRFWTEHDVDLSQVPVSRGQRMAQGFGDFWRDSDYGAEWDQWVQSQAADARAQRLNRFVSEASPRIRNRDKVRF